jgi:hypothetical protein
MCKSDTCTRDGGAKECYDSNLKAREILGCCIIDAICIKVFTVIGFELLRTKGKKKLIEREMSFIGTEQ